MNLLQLAATLAGVVKVYDHEPDIKSRPTGLYAVVFDVSHGTVSNAHAEANGAMLRRESFTESVALYGGQDVPLHALRAVLLAATELRPTHTLAGRPAAGVTYGPHVTVRYDATYRRAWGAARFNLLTQTLPA